MKENKIKNIHLTEKWRKSLRWKNSLAQKLVEHDLQKLFEDPNNEGEIMKRIEQDLIKNVKSMYKQVAYDSAHKAIYFTYKLFREKIFGIQNNPKANVEVDKK
jgi:ubiquitin-protein ligase